MWASWPNFFHSLVCFEFRSMMCSSVYGMIDSKWKKFKPLRISSNAGMEWVRDEVGQIPHAITINKKWVEDRLFCKRGGQII